ncbi:TPA: histidine phosphatase family protein, partial [Enterococcus faecium]|nr:histidine phosphatase family protein [Enterococcus faecium]HAY6722698.1 histidine phosphatase family protein [Enterococcus faecium]
MVKGNFANEGENHMLYVTRHGETTWNAQGLVCGRADVPLT